MKSLHFVSKVSVALGICLIVLALGAFVDQARGSCSDSACEINSCEGQTVDNCSLGGCTTAYYFSCWDCTCRRHLGDGDHCNCMS